MGKPLPYQVVDVHQTSSFFSSGSSCARRARFFPSALLPASRRRLREPVASFGSWDSSFGCLPLPCFSGLAPSVVVFFPPAASECPSGCGSDPEVPNFCVQKQTLAPLLARASSIFVCSRARSSSSVGASENDEVTPEIPLKHIPLSLIVVLWCLVCGCFVTSLATSSLSLTDFKTAAGISSLIPSKTDQSEDLSPSLPPNGRHCKCA